jgi:hypothetical protein
MPESGSILFRFCIDLYRLYRVRYKRYNRYTAGYRWKMLTIFVPSVQLVPLIPWNGTEQGRWFGPIDTAAPRPLQEKAVKAFYKKYGE